MKWINNEYVCQGLPGGEMNWQVSLGPPDQFFFFWVCNIYFYFSSSGVRPNWQHLWLAAGWNWICRVFPVFSLILWGINSTLQNACRSMHGWILWRWGRSTQSSFYSDMSKTHVKNTLSSILSCCITLKTLQVYFRTLFSWDFMMHRTSWCCSVRLMVGEVQWSETWSLELLCQGQTARSSLMHPGWTVFVNVMKEEEEQTRVGVVLQVTTRLCLLQCGGGVRCPAQGWFVRKERRRWSWRPELLQRRPLSRHTCLLPAASSSAPGQQPHRWTCTEHTGGELHPEESHCEVLITNNYKLIWSLSQFRTGVYAWQWVRYAPCCLSTTMSWLLGLSHPWPWLMWPLWRLLVRPELWCAALIIRPHS